MLSGCKAICIVRVLVSSRNGFADRLGLSSGLLRFCFQLMSRFCCPLHCDVLSPFLKSVLQRGTARGVNIVHQSEPVWFAMRTVWCAHCEPSAKKAPVQSTAFLCRDLVRNQTFEKAKAQYRQSQTRLIKLWLATCSACRSRFCVGLKPWLSDAVRRW